MTRSYTHSDDSYICAMAHPYDCAMTHSYTYSPCAGGVHGGKLLHAQHLSYRNRLVDIRRKELPPHIYNTATHTATREELPPDIDDTATHTETREGLPPAIDESVAV